MKVPIKKAKRSRAVLTEDLWYVCGTLSYNGALEGFVGLLVIY